MTACACGCGRQLGKGSARGLANTCYQRESRKGLLNPLPPKPATACACGGRHYAKGLCKLCYQRALMRRVRETSVSGS